MDNPTFTISEEENLPTVPSPPQENGKEGRSKPKVGFVDIQIEENNGKGHTSKVVTVAPSISKVAAVQHQLNLSPVMDLMGNAVSFHLATNYFACCPSMSLTPIQLITSMTETQTPSSNSGQASPPLPQVIECKSEKCFNWCLCCIGPANAQTISISKGDSSEKILSFIYSPHIWCPAEPKAQRLVDIFLKGMNERLGWIDAGRDVGSGSEIHCGLTKESFVTREIEFKGSLRAFKIENSAGIEVANGKIIPGPLGFFGQWSSIQFNFVPSELDTLSHASRAVLLVAFLLWVTDAREKKQWQYIWSVLFVLFLLTCFLLIQFFGPEAGQ